MVILNTQYVTGCRKTVIKINTQKVTSILLLDIIAAPTCALPFYTDKTVANNALRTTLLIAKLWPCETHTS